MTTAPAATRPLARPTTDLQRSVPFTFTRDGEAPGDGLSLSGHAAVFNQDTQISSWEGDFLERIRPGAFRKSIRERTPVMQFDHGKHPLIGSLPIGSISTLREDDQGLYVEGRITDNWLMQPVRDAIAEQTVSGMSFRFGVVREQWTDATGKIIRDDAELMDLLWFPDREGNIERQPLTRELIEVRVAELGPVVFPAYEGTDVGVRAQRIATTVRNDEAIRHSLQRSLAVGADEPAADGLSLDNAQLRREAALALLWPDATRVRTSPDAARSTDATLSDLVAAADALIDQIEPLLADGNVAQAQALLTALDETVDGQMHLLGIDDPDEGDADPSPMPGGMASASARPGSTIQRTQDAPAATGHPSADAPSITDAPAATGHPSPTADQDSRKRYARLSYVTLHSVGKRRFT